jgi:hypothetical protein
MNPMVRSASMTTRLDIETPARMLSFIESPGRLKTDDAIFAARAAP